MDTSIVADVMDLVTMIESVQTAKETAIRVLGEPIEERMYSARTDAWTFSPRNQSAKVMRKLKAVESVLLGRLENLGE